MKKIILVTMLSVLVAGCVSNQNQKIVHVTKKRDLADKEKLVIQDSVKGQLKDPESAMFKLPQVNEDGKPNIYCGLVNAKNSYGGYTGYEPFVATLIRTDGEIKQSSAMLPEPTRYGIRAMISMCKKYGYSF